MGRFAIGFVRFWRDFIIGDDWRIAAGVTAVLCFGAILVSATSLSDTAIAVTTGTAILAVVLVNLAYTALADSGRRRNQG